MSSPLNMLPKLDDLPQPSLLRSTNEEQPCSTCGKRGTCRCPPIVAENFEDLFGSATYPHLPPAPLTEPTLG